jgi:hypothetical protein
MAGVTNVVEIIGKIVDISKVVNGVCVLTLRCRGNGHLEILQVRARDVGRLKGIQNGQYADIQAHIEHEEGNWHVDVVLDAIKRTSQHPVHKNCVRLRGEVISLPETIRLVKGELSTMKIEVVRERRRDQIELKRFGDEMAQIVEGVELDDMVDVLGHLQSRMHGNDRRITGVFLDDMSLVS